MRDITPSTEDTATPLVVPMRFTNDTAHTMYTDSPHDDNNSIIVQGAWPPGCPEKNREVGFGEEGVQELA